MATPAVFNYCGEIMAHLLNQNRNIKGVMFHDIENLLAQFADDTSIYLKYEKICLDAFVRTMEKVEAELGLKVSYDKTTIYRVGSLLNTDAFMYTRKNLKWSNGNVRCENPL